MTTEHNKRTERIPIHKILREVYKHYYEFEALAASGTHVIEHAYEVYDESGENVIEIVPVSISFYDLRDKIEDPNILSERKRQAVLLNVIRDLKQKDTAAIMGISMVSVGQHVDQAMRTLCEELFLGENPEDLPVSSTVLQ